MNDRGDEKRGPVSATFSAIALVLYMAAYFPAMVLVTSAVLACLATLVIALSLAWATPRLAIATLYWSAATFAGSP